MAVNNSGRVIVIMHDDFCSLWANSRHSLHMGFTQGLLATLVADTAPQELHGTAYGMFNLTTAVALLAASVIAGGLWDSGGSQATFLIGALFAMVALGGLLAFDR